jgi:hypothetical protein
MNDEVKYTFLLQILLLLITFFNSKRKKMNFLIHLFITIFYSALFYYLIFYKGDGGSSFVWLFYLWICILLHLFFISIEFLKNRKDKKVNRHKLT